jgi:hypothetical protein
METIPGGSTSEFPVLLHTTCNIHRCANVQAEYSRVICAENDMEIKVRPYIMTCLLFVKAREAFPIQLASLVEVRNSWIQRILKATTDNLKSLFLNKALVDILIIMSLAE